MDEPDSVSPYLQVEIYRPGSEISRFADPKAEIIAGAEALAPVEAQRADEPLASKFGPLVIVSFATSKGTPRRCLGFIRTYGSTIASARAAPNSSRKARWLVRSTG
ncbi:MAG: hypothetical protein WCD56_19420 [Pseudolabrys sp.]